jgi:hypothetical protein
VRAGETIFPALAAIMLILLRACGKSESSSLFTKKQFDESLIHLLQTNSNEPNASLRLFGLV